jgi:hypothetical protein
MFQFLDENVDAVHIDVWNFESMMPVEGVVDRLRRLSEVKDGRGLKQLIVDTVAPPASDRLIGHVEIPLFIREGRLKEHTRYLKLIS